MMSDLPRLRFWKVLGLSESFKLSKHQSLKHPISGLCLILPAGAIAFVSFLTRTEPACGCSGYGGEGKAFTGALQRAQQAYFLENNTLATSLETLKIGLPTETQNYRFQIHTTETAAFHFAIPKIDRADSTLPSDQFPLVKSRSKPPLPSYVSAVFVLPTHPKSVKTILCTAEEFSRIQLQEPMLRDGVPTCAPGTHPL